MKLLKFLLLVVMCSCLPPAEAQVYLQSYIDTALKNNPALEAYRLQSNAIQEKIKPSGALDDPMLFGGVMNLPTDFSFTKDMMTMKQIGIQQNFSVGRKYSLRTNVAQKEFEISTFIERKQQLLLIKEVKQQYYDLYVLNKNIETIQSSIELLKNYFNVANSRYSTGQGTQQDVLKAQLEITKMQDELIKMKSERLNMIAMFNALLFRDKEDLVIIPSDLKAEPIELRMDTLMEEANSNNPDLQAAKIMIAKDSASSKLVKATRIPDFNAGFWYGQRQASMPDGNKAGNMIGFSFGITLPVYSGKKQNPLITASDISIQQSHSQFKALQNETELMLHHAIIEAEKNLELTILYEKHLIPQAEQNLNSGIIGYQQNKIDFMTLTDNFISLYKYRLQSHRAVADYMKALAELEMLTTKSLSEKSIK